MVQVASLGFHAAFDGPVAARLAAQAPARIVSVGDPVGAGAGADPAAQLLAALGAGSCATAARRERFGAALPLTVPDFAAGPEWAARPGALLAEIAEARAMDLIPRPALLGPVTLLSLAAPEPGGFDPVSRIAALLPAYVALLGALHRAGADWVRIDEPVLGVALTGLQRAAFYTFYDECARGGPRIMLTGGQGPWGFGPNAALAFRLPVAGLHLDLTRAGSDLAGALALLRPGRTLSLGAADPALGLNAALAAAAQAARALGADRVQIAPPRPFADPAQA
ncbi:MAG: hypothetical protein ACK4WC_15330, partial [Rubrimonas sp.]